MLDEFESPVEGIAEEGDARKWYAVDDGYSAAGPTESDDPEDEILDDDDDLDDDLIDLDDEFDNEDEDRHRGPGHPRYED